VILTVVVAIDEGEQLATFGFVIEGCSLQTSKVSEHCGQSNFIFIE